MNKSMIKTTLVLVIIVLGFLVVKQVMNISSPTGNVVYNGEKAKLDFYVMSQCPYGTQVEDGVYPVLKKFGNAVQFSLNFIANEDAGTFESLHGENEVKGNIVQLCAQKYNPDKFMDMIICQNKDASKIPGNWESCADGLDKEKIKACYEGEEGKTLLSNSIKASNSVNAQGSPTMYLNGQPYNGGRDETAFTRAICQSLKDHPLCKDIPECTQDSDCTAQSAKDGFCESGKCAYKDPVKVKVTLLNDKRCDQCDATQLSAVIQQIFKGAEITEVDVSDAEGKELAKKYDLKIAPALIFDNAVTQTPVWVSNPRIVSAFEKLDDSTYKLTEAATGASYIFDDEYRKEFNKKLGIDASDSKVQIDFFVMSYCPYGNSAEETVYEVYNALKDKAVFVPRYVIYENYGEGCLDNGNLCSMHGAQELNQNIREMCVYNDLGIGKWFEFAIAMNSKCTSQNADTCWKGVAESLKLDTAKISECEKTQGVKLMRAEKDINTFLGVSGSPTIFIEGQEYSGARDANTLLAAMCANYETAPSECSAKLSTATTAATGGCG